MFLGKQNRCQGSESVMGGILAQIPAKRKDENPAWKREYNSCTEAVYRSLYIASNSETTYPFDEDRREKYEYKNTCPTNTFME